MDAEPEWLSKVITASSCYLHKRSIGWQRFSIWGMRWLLADDKGNDIDGKTDTSSKPELSG